MTVEFFRNKNYFIQTKKYEFLQYSQRYHFFIDMQNSVVKNIR